MPDGENNQNSDTKSYPPVDPDPNYLQAGGTFLAAAGFAALASDPPAGDTADAAMFLTSWVTDLFSPAVAVLGMDTYILGLILVGLGVLLNIVSLAMRPREHYLSKDEQLRRQARTEDSSARPSPA